LLSSFLLFHLECSSALAGQAQFCCLQVFFFAGKGKNNKFAEELKSVLEAVLYMCVQTMPEAAGAVAAGAVADWLLGPREQRQLAIILVGYFPDIP